LPSPTDGPNAAAARPPARLVGPEEKTATPRTAPHRPAQTAAATEPDALRLLFYRQSSPRLSCRRFPAPLKGRRRGRRRRRVSRRAINGPAPSSVLRRRQNKTRPLGPARGRPPKWRPRSVPTLARAACVDDLPHGRIHGGHRHRRAGTNACCANDDETVFLGRPRAEADQDPATASLIRMKAMSRSVPGTGSQCRAVCCTRTGKTLLPRVFREPCASGRLRDGARGRAPRAFFCEWARVRMGRPR